MLARLTDRLGALRVGDPLGEASGTGAVINETQFVSIGDHVAEGLDTVQTELGRPSLGERAARRGVLPRPDHLVQG